MLAAIFMEIINQKKIKQFVVITIVIVIILLIAPLLIYFFQFHKNGISESTDSWADFGSFYGGISGTLLNIVAAFFSLASIYITLLIARKVQEYEHKANEDKTILETKLIHAQSRPYPYLNLSKYEWEAKVDIENQGVGPMIIKRIYLTDKNSQEYRHFSHLFETRNIHLPHDCSINFNTAPTHIIRPGDGKNLLNIFAKEGSVRYPQFRKNCGEILENIEINIHYEDIFGNTFSFKDSLIFLAD